MMRIDYRWLRMVSVPGLRDRARAPRPRVRPGPEPRRRRLRPLARPRTAAWRPPGRDRQARADRLPRPLARQPGQEDRRVPVGHGAVPAHRRAGDRPRLQGARPRDDGRDHADGVHDVLRRRARACGSSARWAGSPFAGVLLVGLKDYQLERIRTFIDPWADPLGDRLPHDPGPARARARRDPRQRPGREQARRRPVPAERLERLHLRDHRRGVRLRRRRPRDRAVRAPRLRRASAPPSGRPTRSARCSPSGSPAWLCFQAFINIAVVVALLPVTGITLPFISAGGSSLLISFAAAGILLSISRETVERSATPPAETDAPRARGGPGDRRTDATADRGRGDRGTHLPGARRRELAPSPTRRA